MGKYQQSKQRDIVRSHPLELARAYRIDADKQLHNPYFTQAQREARHAYCLAQAERLEREHAALDSARRA